MSERFAPTGILLQFVETGDGWDQFTDNDIVIYDPILACDIGPFAKGSQVDLISVVLLDCENNVTYVLIQNGDMEYKIDITINVEFGSLSERNMKELD